MFPFFEKMYRSFSHDIGIDLGTANTLVHLKGHGIVIDEPSIVAINKKTGRVVAVGNEAKKMYGRAPAHIDVIRPLIDGVIADFEIAEEMLAYLLGKAQRLTHNKFYLHPRVVVGIPSGATNVEARAVVDAAKNAGAREVYIIEEPMAAAIGIGLPISDPVGSMVIDIGGGTTDIASIALGGIVQSKNMKIAGDVISQDIMNALRYELKLGVGERTAEDIKINLASALPLEEPLRMNIKGRDLISGLPREIEITDTDIREAISGSIERIVEGAQEVLESTPPEILSDIMRRGVHITGGGALIRKLSEHMYQELKVPVHIADDPLSAVARGAGMVLEDLDHYKEILMQEDDELPTRS